MVGNIFAYKKPTNCFNMVTNVTNKPVGNADRPVGPGL